jgi:alanine dehydrogenase
MRVGVPKEIKTHEYRVRLTPGAAREYAAAGHTVLIETHAGAGIGEDDEAYRRAGAAIVDTAAEIFAQSDMVVKVKEPQPTEWVQLREGQSASLICIWLQTQTRRKAYWPLGAPQLLMKR